MHLLGIGQMDEMPIDEQDMAFADQCSSIVLTQSFEWGSII